MGKTSVLSPFSGIVVPIEEVPDPVFSEKMLGDGLAVEPGEGVALAPINGKLIILHSAGHAFAVQSEGGLVTVLVHIGLDTVNLKGQGFTLHAQVGDTVKAGQRVITFDLGVIAAAGYNAISPVILPDLPEQAVIEKNAIDRAVAGQDVLYTVEL